MSRASYCNDCEQTSGVIPMIVISLSNKVAVVTGGAIGIGWAITLQLAEAGCRGLTIVDIRDDEQARKVASEVEELGSKALFLKADVSKDEDMKMVVEATGKKWGQLDIMVNNAGIAKATDIFTTSVEQWDLVLDVNLRSVFIGMKHAAEYMKEHGGGCIVNMASIAGVTGQYRTGLRGFESRGYCPYEVWLQNSQPIRNQGKCDCPRIYRNANGEDQL